MIHEDVRKKPQMQLRLRDDLAPKDEEMPLILDGHLLRKPTGIKQKQIPEPFQHWGHFPIAELLLSLYDYLDTEIITKGALKILT